MIVGVGLGSMMGSKFDIGLKIVCAIDQLGTVTMV